MSKDEQQKDLQGRVQELLAFAKEKEVSIGATQKITPEGYIENTPLFRDLKRYIPVEEVTGTPFPEELK